MDKHQLEAEARQVLSACVKELKAAGNLPAGSLIVLGCSTSEVSGANIGKGSVPELGEIIAGPCWTPAPGRECARPFSAVSISTAAWSWSRKPCGTTAAPR